MPRCDILLLGNVHPLSDSLLYRSCGDASFESQCMYFHKSSQQTQHANANRTFKIIKDMVLDSCLLWKDFAQLRSTEIDCWLLSTAAGHVG